MSSSSVRERIGLLEQRLAAQPELRKSAERLTRLSQRVEVGLRARQDGMAVAAALADLEQVQGELQKARAQRSQIAQRASTDLYEIGERLQQDRAVLLDEFGALGEWVMASLQYRTDALFAEHRALVARGGIAEVPLRQVREALATEQSARAQLEEAFAERLASQVSSLRSRLAEERAAREEEERARRRLLESECVRLRQSIAIERDDRIAAGTAVLQLLTKRAEA